MFSFLQALRLAVPIIPDVKWCSLHVDSERCEADANGVKTAESEQLSCGFLLSINQCCQHSMLPI